MSNYEKLRSLGVPEDAASCISKGITDSKDVFGNHPDIRVFRDDNSRHPMTVEVDGEDGGSLMLTNNTGGYSPPDANTDKTYPEDVGIILNKNFQKCQKFIP